MNTQLRVFGSSLSGIFGLLGQNENSATYALGWVFCQCRQFVGEFIRDTTGLSVPSDGQIMVELQRSHEAGGFTDIEIVVPGRLHLIVEAKRDWFLPSLSQLTRYRQRLRPDVFPHTAIVSLSAATSEYAANRLPSSLEGVSVMHRSWGDVQSLVRAVLRETTKLEQRVWLVHLDRHLEGFLHMQNPRDNLVFVVVLSGEPIRDGSTYSWIDVVEQDRRYFHPYTNRWPMIPPNYIGFRYGGRFRSVHHIDGYDIVGDLAGVDARWPTTDGQHFVYRLGPPMRPAVEIANGSVHRAAHAWCAIDTLLSGAFRTISDARDETSRRVRETGGEATAL